MSKVFTVIGVCVVAVFGLGAIFFLAMTSGVTAAADGFFDAIRSGDKQLSYSYLSEQFKAGTKAEEFDTFVRQARLGKIVSTSWSNWSVKNNIGHLEGSGTTASGGVIPLTVDLVKERDRWLIYTVSTDFAKGSDGIAGNSSKRAVPNQQAVLALVQNTTAVFAQSIKQNSMAPLHASVSQKFQQEYDVASLDQSFSPFYPLAPAIAELPNRVPEFVKAPMVNERSELVTQGRYVFSDGEYQFTYTYTYEGLGWKIVGINLQTEPYPQQQVAQTKSSSTRAMQPGQVIEASIRASQ